MIQLESCANILSPLWKPDFPISINRIHVDLDSRAPIGFYYKVICLHSSPVMGISRANSYLEKRQI